MFTLTIPITSANLDLLKTELLRTLAEVKSSHRCEAAARGLGFGTYAAMRAAAGAATRTSATVNGAAFASYLAQHDFNVAPSKFYRVVVPVAVRAVCEKVPRLTLWGLGIGGRQRRADGTLESPQELRARFVVERGGLLEGRWAEPFLLSLALVEKVRPTKTIRDGTGSYRLKHIAENYRCRYPEGARLGPQYVPNGMLVAAAIHAGFTIKSHGGSSPNVDFNMSKASVVALDREVRPDRFV